LHYTCKVAEVTIRSVTLKWKPEKSPCSQIGLQCPLRPPSVENKLFCCRRWICVVGCMCVCVCVCVCDKGRSCDGESFLGCSRYATCRSHANCAGTCRTTSLMRSLKLPTHSTGGDTVQLLWVVTCLSVCKWQCPKRGLKARYGATKNHIFVELSMPIVCHLLGMACHVKIVQVGPW